MRATSGRSRSLASAGCTSRCWTQRTLPVDRIPEASGHEEGVADGHPFWLRLRGCQWTTIFPPLRGCGPLVVKTVTFAGLLMRIEIVSPFFPLVPLSTTATVNVKPATPSQRPVPVHVPELPLELRVSTDVLWKRSLPALMRTCSWPWRPVTSEITLNPKFVRPTLWLIQPPPVIFALAALTVTRVSS